MSTALIESPRARRRVVGAWFIAFAGVLMLSVALWLLVAGVSTSSANHRKVDALDQKTTLLTQKATQVDDAVTRVLAKLSTIQVHDQTAAAALKQAQADLQRLLEQAPASSNTTITRVEPGPTVTATVRASPTCAKRHCR